MSGLTNDLPAAIFTLLALLSVAAHFSRRAHQAKLESEAAERGRQKPHEQEAAAAAQRSAVQEAERTRQQRERAQALCQRDAAEDARLAAKMAAVAKQRAKLDMLGAALRAAGAGEGSEQDDSSDEGMMGDT